jgi:hypothetical protein
MLAPEPDNEWRRRHRLVPMPGRQLPFWAWRLVEDDHAPKALSGKKVDVLVRIVGRKLEIAVRRAR